MRFSLLSLFFISLNVQAMVVSNDTPSLCPTDELRVARCEAIERSSDPDAKVAMEQMLVCQRTNDHQFSLRVRYTDLAADKLKETEPMPAKAERQADSTVEYKTELGFSLVLSADRQQAVIRHCVPKGPERGKTPNFSGCRNVMAACK
jgi:hypothetical protein